MRRLFILAVAVLAVMVLGTALTPEPVSASHCFSFASGRVGYTAFGLDRAASFAMCDNDGGWFVYWDANGDWYRVALRCVNIIDDNAYFAGRVFAASQRSWVGNWLHGKVHDGRLPRGAGDQIWGSFTDRTTALNGCTGAGDPPDGPFAVTRGRLFVVD